MQAEDRELVDRNVRLPTDAASRSEWDTLWTLSLFALALSAYLAFLTAHYSYDAVASGVLLYQWMASGDVAPLFHRYHVLYLPAAAAAELALERVDLEVDPLSLLQMLNALFGAAAVALYYRLGRACTLDPQLSALLAVLFGGGFSYAYYATNGESYPISLFFLLLAFLAVAKMPERASWPRAMLPGAWLGLAAGFHGTCLLPLPALVVLAWPGPGDRAGYRRVLAIVLAAGVVIGLPHAVSYLLIQPADPVAGLGADAAAFAAEKGWSMIPRVGDQWLGLVHSMAPASWPALRSSHPALAVAVQLALSAATLLPLALLFGVERTRRRVVLAATVWLAVSFVFFSTYFAGSPKFASYQWAPLLLLAAFAIQEIARRPRLRLVAMTVLAAIAGATVFGTFDLLRRQTDGGTNPHLARAIAIANLTEPDDLIVHLGRGDNQYQKVYLPYFAVRRSVVLEHYFDPARTTASQSIQAVGARLAAAAEGPGRIVVLADAAEAGVSARDFERAHELQEGALAAFFAAYRPRRLAEDPAAGTLWVLDGPASPEPEVRPAAHVGDGLDRESRSFRE